jgi:hypothetical protein
MQMDGDAHVIGHNPDLLSYGRTPAGAVQIQYAMFLRESLHSYLRPVQ